MTGFILPLTLLISAATGTNRIRVALRVPGPVPWAAVIDPVCTAAGLPPGTRLFLGVGEVQPGWAVGAPPLLAGVTLSTRAGSQVPVAATFALAVVGGPTAGRSVPLGFAPVRVGRAPDNDFVVDEPTMSARHATVTPSAAGLDVTDHGSTNGVGIDGYVLAPPGRAVPIGALIRLGDSLLRAGLTGEPAAPARPDGRGHLLVQRTATVPRSDPPDPSPPDLPAVPDRRPVPLLAGLVAGTLGVVLALALGSWMYLAIAAAGPVTVLATAAAERIGGRRRRRRAAADGKRASASWSTAVRSVELARRESVWERCPDPATLLRRAQGVRAGLWSRDPMDPNFWCLSVGVNAGPAPGRGPALGTRGATRPESADRRREARPASGDPPGPAPETPVVVDLARVRVLGLVGQSGPLLRWLVMQAACLFAPGDLGLAIRARTDDLLACSDLPHVAAGRRSDVRSTAGLMVIIEDARSSIGDPAVTELLNAAIRGPRPGERRIVAVCAAQHREELPAGCRAVIEQRPDGPHIRGVLDSTTSPDAGDGGRVVLTGVPRDVFADAVTGLTALLDEPTPGDLPDRVNWGDLAGRPDRDALRSRWRSPTVQAAIGAGPSGVVSLDLDRHGPHLLIAGTTGSGKSELLRTFVAALAVAAPPDRVTFLLIDYKGGAAFAPLTGLPHVAGLITDLDGRLAGRALGSLRAELRHRECLAATAAEPPPRLVIVVDEFAALALDQPTFLAGLVDIAQRGRALGLHLVLATQRPTGVVSPAIRANTSTRICLRVTDPADSLDIVGSTSAADIPATLPGRAVVWTAGAGATPFQAARISGPDDATIVAWRRDGPTGLADRALVDPIPPPDDAHTHSDLDRLIAATVAAVSGLPRPRPPWLPPLPVRVSASEVGSGCVALLDDPDRQCQEELELPAGSVLVLGRPGSGRSTALARIAATACAGGARLAIVDPRGTLRTNWPWPAADTVLDCAEPALLVRLMQLLGRLGSPGPDRGRDTILLVIDGWEDITTAADGADQGATSLALLRMFDSAPTGVRIAASGGIALRHHSVATRATHLLDLDDDGPEPVPGRARYHGHSVQVVQPPDRPPGRRSARGSGVVVTPLPAALDQRGLPPARASAIPIGRGGDRADPQSIDLTGLGAAWVVAGPRRSGVSTTLRTVASGAVAAGIAVWWVAPGGSRRRVAGDTGDGDIEGGVEPAAEWGAEQEPEAHRSRIIRGPVDLQDALARHAGPLLLVVDHDVLIPASGAPPGHHAPDEGHVRLGELLTRFCRVCGPGQFLLIGTRSDAFASAYHGPIAEALMSRRAILLDPEPADGLRLGVRLPRRVGGVPAGRGYLVADGEVVPLQVARWVASDEPYE